MAVLPLLAWAQAAKLVTEFPASAVPMAQDDAAKTFTDKVASFTAADGWGLRVQYKSNGYFFFNTSTGQRGSGTWVIKDSKICTKVQGDTQESCNELRRDAGRVLLKRSSNGEVVELKFAE
ncbi:MAG: hypothetical protein ACRCV9_18220 [Burkholderiaceae bacterium]